MYESPSNVMALLPKKTSHKAGKSLAHLSLILFLISFWENVVCNKNAFSKITTLLYIEGVFTGA